MAHSDKGQNRKRIAFTLLGMSCATCAAIVGKALENKKGIYEINVSYLLDTAYIDYNPEEISEEDIKKLLEKTGYKIVFRKF
jgi:copper chaperone CopZ